MLRIDRDAGRFREIVRGKVRQNLRKYITHGEMIGRQGGDLVSIPLPQLDVPHFRYGRNRGGVGQGDGEPGTPLAPGDPGQGQGTAGGEPAEHLLEVEVPLEELAEILGSELELPRIEPKGKKSLITEKSRFTGVRRTGPESLRHFKRTYKEALRRQIASHSYDVRDPRVVPIRDDKRYRSWKTIEQPETAAAIIYMMDVSGSMTDDQKEIVRIESFWIDAWLKHQYDGLEIRYIIHDAAARLVDEQTFYHTRESGGTRISSAYRLCQQVIEQEFPPDEWNLYCFHFSDGGNWGEDNAACLKLLAGELLPRVNLFCYGQVESPYGSGEFLRSLRNEFGKEHERLVLSEIKDREAIYGSIKTFLGKGR